ncbi:MAG: cysteine-rich CWC family protein [Rhizobacter sp.]
MDTNDRCPRCGGGFVCEAATALQSPCACFAVRLSDGARALLRERYTTCLCVPCLRSVQAEAEAEVTPPSPRPPGAPPGP